MHVFERFYIFFFHLETLTFHFVSSFHCYQFTIKIKFVLLLIFEITQFQFKFNSYFSSKYIKLFCLLSYIRK